MANELVSMSVHDMNQIAKAVATSGLFGIKTQDQALALMAIAQAEGRHPALAARDYHIIQGRPSLKAEVILARFQQAGGSVSWTCSDDSKCEAAFSHPQGGNLTIGWDMERAKRAGLAGKDVWKSYPRAMLRSRVITEGIRAVYPVVLAGFYSVDEVRDFADPTKPPVEVSAEVVDSQPPPHTEEHAPAPEEPITAPPIDAQADSRWTDCLTYLQDEGLTAAADARCKRKLGHGLSELTATEREVIIANWTSWIPAVKKEAENGGVKG